MADADDNFESLRKLLSLKRHEQPPLGHFDLQAQEIIRRLESGQGETVQAWWERLMGRLDFRPALAGALGLAVGAFYFLGWSWSKTLELEANHAPFIASQPWVAASQPPLPPEAAKVIVYARSAAPVVRSSVYPVVGAGDSRAWINRTVLHGMEQIQTVNFRVPQY